MPKFPRYERKMKYNYFKDIHLSDFPETINPLHRFTLAELYGRDLTEDENGWEYAFMFEKGGWEFRPLEARIREKELIKRQKKSENN